MHLELKPTIRRRATGRLFFVILTLTALLLAWSCTAYAATYTLTSANSTITIDPSSQVGMNSWVVDGVNQLNQQWWWYRTGDGSGTLSADTIATPVVTQIAPNMIDATYVGGSFDLVVRYILTGGDSGSASSNIGEILRIRNKTADVLNFHLYEYSDLDLNATPDDDTAVLVNASTISQWDGSLISTETAAVGGITPAPNHWEIGQFPSLIGKLNAPLAGDLADAVSPLDRDNATFAFQWDMVIPAGGIQLLSKSKSLARGGAIGDTVWNDIDGNTLQDAGEPGIPNVKVILQGDLNFDGIVDFTADMLTDSTGYYLFPNLPGGDYAVTVDASTLPLGAVQTYDLDGLATPNLAVLTLATGETNLDVDFGYTVTETAGSASLSGLIFRDCDADHKYDQGEDGLEGVTVTLKDSDGNVVGTTVTDSTGHYGFTDLEEGTYTISVDQPADYIRTFDVDGVLDNGTTVTLVQDEVKTGLDFGYTGNRPEVYIEKTGPATAKVGETITYHFMVANTGNTCLYGGMSVKDCMLGGTIFHKTPVSPGEVYEFDVRYTIKSCDHRPLVNTATAIGCPPLGGQVTATSTWTVQIGTCETSKPGCISGRVWKDKDGDGREDWREVGLSCVKLSLKDGNGKVVATTKTNCQGCYSFTNIPAGSYRVCVNTDTVPSGYSQTFDTDGLRTPNSAVVTVKSGAWTRDRDFGYKPKSRNGHGGCR